MSSSSQWLQLAASALVTGVALYGAYYLTWGQYGVLEDGDGPAARSGASFLRDAWHSPVRAAHHQHHRATTQALDASRPTRSLSSVSRGIKSTSISRN